MEEGKEATVLLQAIAQVVPSVDFVHGLIFDDLLQDLRGRVPVDALQVEKTAIEPSDQQMSEVGFDGGKLWALGESSEQFAAHGNEHAGSAGCHIEAPEEFQTGRLNGSPQGIERVKTRVGAIALRGVNDYCRIG